MWLTIDGRVYDVTKFAAMHPGGEAFIAKYAGKVCLATASGHMSCPGSTAGFLFGNLFGANGIPWTVANEEVKDLPPSGSISMVPFAESSYWQVRQQATVASAKASASPHTLHYLRL
eukprot:scaffold473199_cov40-Prasinocladus_malaysianus.AAC.1